MSSASATDSAQQPQQPQQPAPPHRRNRKAVAVSAIRVSDAAEENGPAVTPADPGPPIVQRQAWGEAAPSEEGKLQQQHQPPPAYTPANHAAPRSEQPNAKPPAAASKIGPTRPQVGPASAKVGIGKRPQEPVARDDAAALDALAQGAPAALSPAVVTTHETASPAPAPNAARKAAPPTTSETGGLAAAAGGGGNKLREVYVVKHAFEATEEKQLTVAKGDIITIRAKHPQGWWQGILEDGRRGWVPGEFLKLAKDAHLVAAGITAEGATPASRALAEARQATGIDGQHGHPEAEQQPQHASQGDHEKAPTSAAPSTSTTAATEASAEAAGGAGVAQHEPQTQGAPRAGDGRPPPTATADDKTASDASLFYARYPFEAQQPRQLTLKRDDVVRVRSEKPSGWWQVDLLDAEGEIAATGWVPGRFLRECKPKPVLAGAQAAEERSEDSLTKVTFIKPEDQGLGIGIGGGKVRACVTCAQQPRSRSNQNTSTLESFPLFSFFVSSRVLRASCVRLTTPNLLLFSSFFVA